jgi:hypothetical protein
MDRVAAVFPQPCNHKLEAEFLTELIHSSVQFPNSQPEQLIGEAIAHFRNFNDPDLECKFATLLF